MAASPKPSRRIAARFDSANLDRTIMAVPLRKAIEDVAAALGTLPKTRHKDHDTVIYLARTFPEGPEAAEARLRELLGEVARKLGIPIRAVTIAPVHRPGQPFRFAKLDWKDAKPRKGEQAQVERRLRLLLAERDREEPFPTIDRLWPTDFDVIVNLNLRYPDGREAARDKVRAWLAAWEKTEKTEATQQYVFACMPWTAVRELVDRDAEEAEARSRTAPPGAPRNPDSYRSIYSIWPDFPIKPCLTKSLITVKADAAQCAFSALGEGVTWAVVDSGIQGDHPHFQLHRNLDAASPLHRDFTDAPAPRRARKLPSPLVDGFGHGTHVAGIIAGEYDAAAPGAKGPLLGVQRQRCDRDVKAIELRLTSIRSVAPKTNLVSLKVLDDQGIGDVGNVVVALSHIFQVNGNGRDEQRIHGVNISLGYEFDPEWFACGESPVCNEVDRLVRSGVVVVVAAGNTGFGTMASSARTTKAGLDVTINDPGNAEFAITVGSTHREMPHRYGVSYFSSKGPTGDGRPKPDLIAPGEKILSCGTGALLATKLEGTGNGSRGKKKFHYVEESGTSMAAPHVSGVIAAFLSVRREFRGKPERVKEIFMSTATDLRRDRYFQGAGLVDLMRAIQSV